MFITEKNEVVGLGNVVVIFGIVFKIVQGWSYEEQCKIKSKDSCTKIYAKFSIY